MSVYIGLSIKSFSSYGGETELDQPEGISYFFNRNSTDAFTIDANQKVICNGSLITNINYNNIDGFYDWFCCV